MTRPLELRDYQQEMLSQAQWILQQNSSLLIGAPTGSGKTVVLAEMMARGILCPALVEAPIIRGPDGCLQRMALADNLPQIYLEAFQYCAADGRRKVILYVSQTPSQTPAEVMSATTTKLREAGIQADAISQDLGFKQRDRALKAFQKAAGLAVLVNYATLTEGTDLPEVDAVILGRHTESESTIIQMIGRGLCPAVPGNRHLPG